MASGALAECKQLPDGNWDCEDKRGPGPGDDGDDPGPGPTGPKVGDTKPEEYLTPACPTNGPPPGGGDALCGNAVNSCRRPGDGGQEERGIRMFVYTRTLEWDGDSWEPTSSWDYQETRCDYPDDEDELEQVTGEMVIERVEGMLPKVEVAANPPNGRTLVNFDTILYTDGSKFAPPPFTLVGRTVRVEATKVGYDWVFGDGQTLHTTHPGRKWGTEGSNPYIKHRYTTATKAGEKLPVDVRITWNMRFSVDGGPMQDAGTTDPLPSGNPMELEVLTDRTVLNGN